MYSEEMIIAKLESLDWKPRFQLTDDHTQEQELRASTPDNKYIIVISSIYGLEFSNNKEKGPSSWVLFKSPESKIASWAKRFLEEKLFEYKKKELMNVIDKILPEKEKVVISKGPYR